MEFQLKLLDARAEKTLKRSTPMSGGYDVIACIDQPLSIRHGDKPTLIPTGFALFSNRADVIGLILPRSGLGHKQGLVLGNTIGVVDGDYQEQWFVSAWNRGQQDEIIINPGDRIVQVLFVPVYHPTFNAVNEFSSTTERGLGGFGSTGVGSGTDHASTTESVSFLRKPLT